MTQTGSDIMIMIRSKKSYYSAVEYRELIKAASIYTRMKSVAERICFAGGGVETTS